MKHNLIIILFLFTSVQGHAQCFKTSAEVRANLREYMLSKTTNNGQLDALLNQEAAMLYDVFGVHADLYLYDENNAVAIPYSIDDSRFDGTISLGIPLIRESLWMNNPNRGWDVSATMAHEFAHILQFQKEYPEMRVKWQELHADFLAGYYLGRMKSYQPGAVQAYAQSFYAIGDTDFWSEDHHGTPNERVNFMLMGYDHRGYSLKEAYLRGLDIINRSR